MSCLIDVWMLGCLDARMLGCLVDVEVAGEREAQPVSQSPPTFVTTLLWCRMASGDGASGARSITVGCRTRRWPGQGGEQGITRRSPRSLATRRSSIPPSTLTSAPSPSTSITKYLADTFTNNQNTR
jgi:hypothetical protein